MRIKLFGGRGMGPGRSGWQGERGGAAGVAASALEVRIAHAAVVVTLPSGLWRVAMASTVPVGFSRQVLRSVYQVPGTGTLAILAISAVQEALALLTLGLVRPWGQVVPGWVPGLGGRRIRPLAALVPATVGSVLLVLLVLVSVGELLVLDPDRIDAVRETRLSGVASAVQIACYLPLVGWGPLLGVSTWLFYRRHRRAGVPL